MEELKLKRRRGFLMAVIFVFVFIFMIVISNVLIYAFEYKFNDDINNINDAFGIIESIYQLPGQDSLYAVSIGGRITSFATLILSIIFFILFAAQVFNIITSFNFYKRTNKSEKNINHQESDMMEESEQDKELEKDILNKQDKILRYEENIIKKLDRLREEKKKHQE